ncbi:hypothetical protein N7510_000332 [Penicillium lagena]|uniref:uncharacterized protein n=1 Tax=Penicillium lagena TaxID=94218 RepID=UPI002541153F|nr:uncharacterized protein N7510_000332 [Penicillium lagena]KAJ5624023.1 hypothetical protein N7510_000332 [Penicillium lagena]
MALLYRIESPRPNSLNPALDSTPAVASRTSVPPPAATVHTAAAQNHENGTQVHYPWHDTGEQLDSSHTSAESLRVQYIQENPFQNPGPATNQATVDPEPSMRTPPQTPAAGANKFPASNGLHNLSDSTNTEKWGISQSTSLKTASKKTSLQRASSQNGGTQLQNWLCEFSTPCLMTPSPDGMHFRKVVSHVFGRNKASTKLFPPSVWVHYCRKHYQRARYRADQWPFTQCELLVESLNRMMKWGGVESFELILRRREMLRVDNGDESSDNAGASKSSKKAPRGRKNPTAIIAPVPDWLRSHVGRGKTFEDIRQIVSRIRQHLLKVRDAERAQSVRHSTNGPATAMTGTANSNNNGTSSHRRQQASRVRFPDIEVLPTFRPWVLDAALQGKGSSEHPSEHEGANGHVRGETNRLGHGDGTDAPTAHDGGAMVAGPDLADPPESQNRTSRRLLLRISERGSVKKPRDRGDF